MSIHQTFSNRFTLLRKTYSLTYADCADILGAKNKTTISEWVNSEKWPNGAMLNVISMIFAVSLDWLLGNVENPYREDYILKLETEQAIPTFMTGIPLWKQIIPEQYLDPDKRRENYTLGQRANLIFAALSSSSRVLFAQFSLKEIKRGDFNFQNLDDIVKSANLLNTYIANIKNFGPLLRGELDKPVFDLETAIEAEKAKKTE